MTPEPDFDRIARTLLDETFTYAEIAEQLRLVWNARGAADLATVQRTVTQASDTWIVSALERALHMWDR